MIEIEKKFVLTDPEAVRARLRRLGTELGRVLKEDFYFALFSDTSIPFVEDGDPHVGPEQVRAINRAAGADLDDQRDYHFVRLRGVDREKAVITLKLRSSENGLERNVEDERELAPDRFRTVKQTLAHDLGLTLFFTKTKDSTMFDVDGAVAELVLAPEIDAWFLEVEYGAEPSEMERAQRRLDAVLARMGFAHAQPEPRPYPRLIKDALEQKFGGMTLAKMSELNLERFRDFNIAGAGP